MTDDRETLERHAVAAHEDERLETYETENVTCLHTVVDRLDICRECGLAWPIELATDHNYPPTRTL